MAPEILFGVFSADIESRKAVPDGCLRIFKTPYRPCRLTVRSPDFQSGNVSSILTRVTRKPTHAAMVDAMCANNKKQFLTAKAQQSIVFFETASK